MLKEKEPVKGKEKLLEEELEQVSGGNDNDNEEKCPNCQRNVTFVKSGVYNKCPKCHWINRQCPVCYSYKVIETTSGNHLCKDCYRMLL